MNYVVGYLFSEDKSKVALSLIKKTNYPVEQSWQEGCFNGLGGKIQDVGYIDHPEKTWITSSSKETPEEAMRREFLEEGGVDFPYWKLFLTIKKKNYSMYHFKGFSTERLNQVKTSSSEGEVVIVPINELLYLPVIDLWRIFLAREDTSHTLEEIE